MVKSVIVDFGKTSCESKPMSSGIGVLNRAKNYTYKANRISMNRVLTALACLTLLLVSVPLTTAQLPTASVSITCDQSIHEFTDSLTNQSIVARAQSPILQRTRRRFLLFRQFGIWCTSRRCLCRRRSITRCQHHADISRTCW